MNVCKLIGRCTHTSAVVSSVVNQSLCPVWLRSAYGTKGERRRCPAGLPLGDCSDVFDGCTHTYIHLH